MLTYNQLSPTQQERAVRRELQILLEGILEGHIRFADSLNGDNLQARIDAAIAQADKMQTPWFAHKYVLEVCSELQGMARMAAMYTQYHLPGEHCQYLIEV